MGTSQRRSADDATGPAPVLRGMPAPLGARTSLYEGAGALDGGEVRAEVRLDHPWVVEDLGRRALGDHPTELEGDHAVAEPGQQRHVVLDHEDRRTRDGLHALEQRTERL